MRFDYLLILLPILLAVGALIRVLTWKSPTYHRKRNSDAPSSASGDDSKATIDIDHSSPESDGDGGD